MEDRPAGKDFVSPWTGSRGVTGEVFPGSPQSVLPIGGWVR
jgi:hypothetical protein